MGVFVGVAVGSGVAVAVGGFVAVAVATAVVGVRAVCLGAHPAIHKQHEVIRASTMLSFIGTTVSLRPVPGIAGECSGAAVVCQMAAAPQMWMTGIPAAMIPDVSHSI